MRHGIWGCAALLLVACGDDRAEIESTRLAISAPELVVGPDGGRAEVAVSSSGPWRLTGRKTWCRPSVVAGVDGDRVVFTADPNDDPASPRSVTYTFMCAEKAVRYTVTQTQVDMVVLPKEEWEVSAEGGRLLIDMQSNAEFDIAVPEEARDWLEFVGTRALERSVLEFVVRENDTYKLRSAELELGGDVERGALARLTIRQQQNKGILVENAFAPTAGGETLMTIRANVPYSVSVDYMWPSWVRLDGSITPPPAEEAELVAREVRFVADATSAYDGTRIARVTVQATDDSGITVKGLILQRYGDAVFLEIEDEKFLECLLVESYVFRHDDGAVELLGKGAAATTMNSLSYSDIRSIAGIERFAKLTEVNISSNYIERADFSANTALTTLSFTRSGLKELVLGDAPVTKVPGGFSSLKPELTDASRKGVDAFRVSGTQLRTFKVQGTSELKSFDVSGCPALETLECRKGGFATLDITANQQLTSLDVSENAALQTVYMTEAQRNRLATCSIGNARIEYR